MFDLYTSFRLVGERWSLLLVAGCIVILCVSIVVLNVSTRTKAITLLLSVIGAILLGHRTYVDYYITMLGDENDALAETGFNQLKGILSDQRLVALISRDRGDGNEQFYLAILAAQRGIHIPTATLFKKPWFGRGNSYSDFGRKLTFPIGYEAFVSSYEATKIRPGGLSATNLTNSHYSAGLLAANDLQFTNAIAEFTLAIDSGGGNALCFYSRGLAYYSIGLMSQAMLDAEACINMDSNMCDGYNLKAAIHAQSNANQEALSDYGTIITLDPTRCPDAYANRAMIYARIGEYMKGIADCESAIRLDGFSSRGYNNLAWLLCACPDGKVRDGKRAVAFAIRACELAKWSEPHYLGTLAAAYAEIGSFGEAVKWQRKSMEFPLSLTEMAEAKQRLMLFEQSQPFHEKLHQN